MSEKYIIKLNKLEHIFNTLQDLITSNEKSKLCFDFIQIISELKNYTKLDCINSNNEYCLKQFDLLDYLEFNCKLDLECVNCKMQKMVKEIDVISVNTVKEEFTTELSKSEIIEEAPKDELPPSSLSKMNIEIIFQSDYPTTSIAYINDDMFATGHIDGSINFWYHNNKEFSKLTEKYMNSAVYALLFLSETEFVTGDSSNEGIATLWQFRNGLFNKPLKIKSIRMENRGVYCFGSIDAKTVACGMLNGSIFVWDINQNKVTCKYSNHQGYILCILSIENYLISGGADKSISLCDLNTKELVISQPNKEHTNYVLCLVKLKSNIFASASYDKYIKIWKIGSPESIMTLKIHSDYVYSLMFYKDTIISGSADKTMKLTKLTLDNNTFEVIESMNIEDEFSRIIQLNKEFSKFATIDFESTKIYTTTELMLKF